MSSAEEISEDNASQGSDYEPIKKPKPVKMTGNKTGVDKKPDKAAPNSNPPKKSRDSIERIYQKKTQKEHILLRPDTYIGSVEKITQIMWVADEDSGRLEQREIIFVPGLYKIFDEILVNACDNKQRDSSMSCIRIDLNAAENKIRIWNNGKGIPVTEHREHHMLVPSLIFGHLLTSSNYDDTQKKVTGGRNGFGAKLCNIFSSRFEVETSSSQYGKQFKQVWTRNMDEAGEPKVTPSSKEDFTSITFVPDLTKFGMHALDRDTMGLFTRRAYDAAATSDVRVFLNGKRLPITNFKEYIELCLKDRVDDDGKPLDYVYHKFGNRWEVAVALSSNGFQQVSFVNSIATTKGGTHVDLVCDQLCKKLLEIVKKKAGKDAGRINPAQVKNYLWLFVKCLIENPAFDSQTKETLTLQTEKFGSKCEISDEFVKKVSKVGVVDQVLNWVKFRAMEKLDAQCSKRKTTKIKGIPKLDDANDAGGKNSALCTLILTEGDSAKALAVAGLGVIGRDHYGVFPLRGKVLNVRDASAKAISENAEITSLLKILGLQYKQSYESGESVRSLRYGKIMIMTDQDQDGSHIKGLLINFIHANWPNLLRHGFLEEFITPIVKVFKGSIQHAFYSIPEFEEWKMTTPNWHKWRVKYYKGLGTSTSKEAREYFSDMDRHRIRFRYTGQPDDRCITMAFAKKLADDRKKWLSDWMESRRRRIVEGLPEDYLYEKDTRVVTYHDFVNKELVLFSNEDNERSIPSLVDGFKPGQRKVLFACFKRKLFKELKVAQLAGSVAELSAYHHGEVSLMSTIIGLAQNFVGSNNINLLKPIGQFGTRLHGGKDAASPRYIFTQLSALSRVIFNELDDPVLNYVLEDNQRVEPDWYCPILPMVLVNGAEGIGTGWSTKIPNYNPREIVDNIRRLLRGDKPLPMHPWFKGFHGQIVAFDDKRYATFGEVSYLDDQRVEISELPIRVWTQTYKEDVLEPLVQGTDKAQPVLADYKEYHTDITVRFVLKFLENKLHDLERGGLHKSLKLYTSLTNTTMVLFDSKGCIKRFDRVEDIIEEFFPVRLELYKKRKVYLIDKLTAEALTLKNKARFIVEKIEGDLVLEDRRKAEIVKMLVERKYDPDPVLAWKRKIEAQQKSGLAFDDEAAEGGGEVEAESESSETEEKGVAAAAGGVHAKDYDYLMCMAFWNLSREKKETLLRERDLKIGELNILSRKSPEELWREDLDAFIAKLDEVEAEERDEEQALIEGCKSSKSGKGDGGKRGKGNLKAKAETRPDPHAERIPIPPASAVITGAAAKAKGESAASKRGRPAKQPDSAMEGDDEGSKMDAGTDDLLIVDEETSRPPTALSDVLTVASTQPEASSSQSLPPQLTSSQQSQPKKSAPPKKPAAGSKAALKPRSKRTPSEDGDAYSIPSDADNDDLNFGGFDDDARVEKRVFRERKPKPKAEEPKFSDDDEEEFDNDDYQTDSDEFRPNEDDGEDISGKKRARKPGRRPDQSSKPVTVKATTARPPPSKEQASVPVSSSTASKSQPDNESPNSSGRSEQENAASAPPKMRTLATIETFVDAKKRVAATEPSKKSAAVKTTKPKPSEDDDEDFQPKRARGPGPRKPPAKKQNRFDSSDDDISLSDGGDSSDEEFAPSKAKRPVKAPAKKEPSTAPVKSQSKESDSTKASAPSIVKTSSSKIQSGTTKSGSSAQSTAKPSNDEPMAISSDEDDPVLNSRPLRERLSSPEPDTSADQTLEQSMSNLD